MRFFNKSLRSRSVHLNSCISCISWLLLLTILFAQCSVHADEEWFTRSQNILNSLEGQPRPTWLDNNPYQDQAQRHALDIVKDAKPIALDSLSALQKPLNNGKPLRVMFLSFSLGESVLKGIFEEASGQEDVLLVFRGPKPQQKLPGLFAELKVLLKDISPVPNIVIDPIRFQKWAVTTVPEIVVEDQGKASLRVKGVTSLTWLKSRQDVGQQGDLGRFGEVYDITELDLLEEIKRRLAAIDWPQKKQQALARFWEQRTFEALPNAQENLQRMVDLTITAPHDLLAPNGKLIIQAGQTVNPLEKMAFGLCLIVFDATQKAQVDTVRQWSCRDKKARVMYLATQLPRQDGWEGLKALEQVLKAPVYLLTPDVHQRFQLQKIPALVEQSGNKIQVQERKVTSPTLAGAH